MQKEDHFEIYNEQTKNSFLSLITEIPVTAVYLVAALRSMTGLVWISFIDSFCFAVKETVVLISCSKFRNDLSYTYNYGIVKIETLVSLCCDAVNVFGLIIAIFYGINEFGQPQKIGGYFAVAALLSLFDTVLDGILVIKQRKIKAEFQNPIAVSEYNAMLKDLVLDSLLFLSMLLCYIMKNGSAVNFVCPLISILLAVFFIVRCIKNMRSGVDQLSDKTLDEKEQLKILRVLNSFHDEYSGFGSVNSHRSGSRMLIDFDLTFPPETPYEKIAALRSSLEARLNEDFGDCAVTIVISGDEK